MPRGMRTAAVWLLPQEVGGGPSERASQPPGCAPLPVSWLLSVFNAVLVDTLSGCALPVPWLLQVFNPVLVDTLPGCAFPVSWLLSFRNVVFVDTLPGCALLVSWLLSVYDMVWVDKVRESAFPVAWQLTVLVELFTDTAPPTAKLAPCTLLAVAFRMGSTHGRPRYSAAPQTPRRDRGGKDKELRVLRPEKERASFFVLRFFFQAPWSSS